jgi:hypothetical protein
MKDFYRENCQNCMFREGGLCNKYNEYISHVTIEKCKKERTKNAKPIR